jgi:hypothetical protein
LFRDRDIIAANFIINNPETPNETLLAIKDRMDSLSDKHTLSRNAPLSEYLTVRNELEKCRMNQN